MTTRRHACAPATRQAVRGDRAQHRSAAQRAVIRHWATRRTTTASTDTRDRNRT